MQIKKFTFNPFQENTYLVYDEAKNAVLIDPGCSTVLEQNQLDEVISTEKLSVLAILNTHCHIDHVFGNAYLSEKYNVEIYTHKGELETLASAQKTADMYGISNYIPSPIPTQFVQKGDFMSFGEMTFEVLFVPGHSIAHIAFYSKKEKILFGGDVLFKDSFGRYDLPGGSLSVLKNSITGVFFQLPPETIIYSGHGLETTIGKEIETNPIHRF